MPTSIESAVDNNITFVGGELQSPIFIIMHEQRDIAKESIFHRCSTYDIPLSTLGMAALLKA